MTFEGKNMEFQIRSNPAARRNDPEDTSPFWDHQDEKERCPECRREADWDRDFQIWRCSYCNIGWSL